MVNKMEFLFHVIPFGLYPIEYPNCNQGEQYLLDLFESRVYKWVIEDGIIAIYAGVKFWLTLNEFEFNCCSAQIMPTPLELTEFAEQINNRELLTILESNQYNKVFYCKFFINS